ncbi:MAG: hypothetical protein K0R15_2186 [Clostridiales bacterium]|jgi:flagellar basal-body rod protein FlgG|nr:hypothetical protein [Clostridiales bacterium]
MVRGLYTAASGMVSQQQRMDSISNNLANVNTTGYKRENLLTESFDSVLTIKINDVGSIGMRDEAIGRMTLGITASETYTDYSQGTLTSTSNPLNVALNGEGFIAVTMIDAEGNQTEVFTRDGSFVRTPDGYLSTNDGNFIQGEEGLILIPSGETIIDKEGKIYVDNNYIDTIRVVDFDNKQTLEKLGSNLYAANENATITEFKGQVVQNALEGSNVNTVREMVDLITLSRTYQANQVVMKSFDSTLEKAVNSIGKV